MFEYWQRKHQKDYELFQKGYSNSSSCEKKFENYFIRIIKDDLKTIFGINNINKINMDIDQETNDTINEIIDKKKLSFKEKELNTIKKIISYCKNNIDQCEYLNQSNFLNFRFYLYARIAICKYESDDELRKIIGNNLDNLNKIFYNKYDIKIGEKPVYKGITNEPEQQLKSFVSNIESKIKDIKLDISEHNVAKVLEDSIFEINTVLKNLKDKIEENLKQKKKVERYSRRI